MATYADEAERLRKTYAARLEALRNRRDLSDEGVEALVDGAAGSS